jgi:hypothetical protein
MGETIALGTASTLASLSEVAGTRSWFTAALTSPAFWAAVVAAIAGIAAAIGSFYSSHQQRRHAERERQIEFSRRQLNELYGPILTLRQASDSLRDFLPRTMPDGSRWKLVEHVKEVKNGADEAAKTAVGEILKINRQLEEIILGKSGLLETFPPPPSFKLFIRHARLLQVSWDRGTNHPKAAEIPFPESIDNDIARDIDLVMERLKKLQRPPIGRAVVVPVEQIEVAPSPPSDSNGQPS